MGYFDVAELWSADTFHGRWSADPADWTVDGRRLTEQEIMFLRWDLELRHTDTFSVSERTQPPEIDGV